jgi:HEAT repeat protein
LPLVVLAATLWAAAAAGAEPASSDPVEQLREALRAGRDSDTSEAALTGRENNVKLRADGLNRLPDLGRALLLEEWRDEERDSGAGAIDRAVRAKLATRFRTGVQEVLRKGDALRRAAAANLVGEIAANARASRFRSVVVGRMLGELAPDLAKATTDAAPSVREAAAVALSKIDDPARPKARLVAVEVAVPAYKKMLAMQDAASRRVAAAALGELLRTLNDPDARWTKASTFDDLLHVGPAVVPVLAGSLRDADPEVRRRSLEALRQAALGLADSVEETSPREQLEQVVPLVKALRDRVPAVATALEDEAAMVPACAALEAIADTRRRLVRWAAAIACSPEEKKGNGKVEPQFTDVLGPELRRAAPALTKPLASKDVRTRLAALYALETFDDAAAPAAAALVKALADADPFVRWGAVRALGRMASPQGAPAAAEAKAFSELARRLGDDSEEVRVTAAAALVRYGPAARAAGPETVRFVNEGDPETRVLAIQVLAAVKANAKVTVPALTKALAAKEAAVRLAAIKALAGLGADAAPASEKLRELMLRDPDVKVRQATGAAFLEGVPSPKPAEIPSRPGEREGPPGAPGEPAQLIAPDSGLDDPLNARDLARAMFEASQSDPKQNARQRLETVRRAYQAAIVPLVGDTVGWPMFDTLLELSGRWVAAELALCEAPAERAAAYHRPWQDAWKTERIAKAKVDAGRDPLEYLNASRYERLTAEMEWVRAGAGKEKTRPSAETYPGLPRPEVPFDGEVDPGAEWAWPKAQFEASRADLGELAQQRITAIRAVYRALLERYLVEKVTLDEFHDAAVRLTEAELAFVGSKVDAAALCERAWEMAWMTHEITRRHFIKAGRKNLEYLPRPYAAELVASRYALLQAEIALVQAGQARRPGRVSALLNDPDLAQSFDAKRLAQARAAVGWADLDDLLGQRLETARAGYRAHWEFFLAGKETPDVLVGWSRRLLESELALADGPAGREAALARHWKRVWQAEAVIQRRYDEGREISFNLMELRYARLEAERLWTPWQARK